MNYPDTALVARVEQTVRRHRLFLPGDTLIVALSGGADSTALLDLLTRLTDYNLHLIAAHLNHCLRGVESDTDQEFCRGLASRYAIPFEFRRIDVKRVASKSRLNLEDAGRRARIDFLDEIRSEYGAAAVVLAHHADDQAETVLMRLLRGSGMTGLSGMAYRNARGYVRPLLDINRSEIEQYLRRCSMEWREDASNSDTTYLRNRIRHQLLPLLEEYNPAIRSSLASTASILGDDEALLDELTERAYAKSCRIAEGRIICSVGQLRLLNIALRRRVLRHVFKQLTGTLERVSLRHIDAICAMIDSERPNSQLALPQGVTAVREYDSLLWMQAGEVLLRLPSTPFDSAQGKPLRASRSATVLRLRSATVLETDFELLITEPGCYQLPCGSDVTVELKGTVSFPTDSGTACFDLAKSPFPWLVRTFRPGDRITPFGMSGRKKVKDIFIDRKIPLSERKNIPLLFCCDDLIWIAGVCVSELCRIDTPSSATVQVTWQTWPESSLNLI
jgi:tRNA(Ile)-lysidine synthase